MIFHDNEIVVGSTLGGMALTAVVMWGVVGYMLVALLWARHLFRKELRGRREPVGKDRLMLRMPGQALSEKLAVVNDQLSDKLTDGIVPGLVIVAATLLGLEKVADLQAKYWILGVGALGLTFTLVRWVGRLRTHFRERRKLRLGLKGEQLVADSLLPLMGKGYHVFHDVPAQGAVKAFNLDHVVVGPAGVFVVETKTRSKPTGENANHKVSFDGIQLHWPWGTDAGSCGQARSNADWLKAKLHQALGLDLVVEGLLVLPGWWVDRKGQGALRVLNDKELVTAIDRKAVFDDKTVDQVRRTLDGMARTVSWEG